MPHIRIPIHWASEEELRKVKGIGLVRAAAIRAAQLDPDSLLGPWVLPALLGISEKQALDLADEFCWDALFMRENAATRQYKTAIWWAGVLCVSIFSFLLSAGLVLTTTPAGAQTQWW